ncbi:hypothetical protein AB0K40_24760 [Nonomuraea bangladeshensis]|uniref:HNH endonuclease n=1 Tax=Nonomuraea bangladeshensis TaxID=404385 RepID=A0ABV3H898_9ACTN
MKDSECRWCGEVFYGVRPGSKAPLHDNPSTNKRCAGTGQKTGAHVE